MWDKKTAQELVKQGERADDDLTKRLATYLGFALQSVEYYENLYIKERDKK